jgi:hypothetical protein
MEYPPVVNNGKPAEEVVAADESTATKFLAKVMPWASVLGAIGVNATDVHNLSIYALKVYIGVAAAMHLYQAALPKVKTGVGFVVKLFGKKS